MKISSLILLPLLSTPLLWAESDNLLPLYKALKAGDAQLAAQLMCADKEKLRHNNAFFTICQQAIEQGDVAFFAGMPTAYLNELCGPVDSPFAGMDGYPKGPAYFAPPLLHAAAAGKTEIVRELLQRGANTEEPEYYGRTAIVYAAANGHLPCVEMLHRAGAAELELALQVAILFNRAEVVDYLQRHGVEPPAVCAELSQRTPTGETALMRAVAEGDVERVGYVLQYAPQLLNMQNSYGETALMQAASADNLTAVMQLIACGADLGMKNDLGLTALDVAYQATNSDVVAILVQAGAPAAQPQLALRYACAVGDVELARRLLTAGGVNVNARPAGEVPLLRYAVNAQSVDMVRLLLEHGARAKGAGALSAAVEVDHPQLVRLLMAHDNLCLPTERRPRHGFSPQEKLNAALHAACRQHATKTVKMLLEMGAEVNDTRMTSYGHYATGNSPLHEAARGPVEILTLLLDAGADVNARNKEGDTPLMLAARFRHGEAYPASSANAMLLLERGADATLTNKAGENVADMAWHAPLVQALGKAGIKKTPFSHPLADAVFAEDAERVRALLAAGENPDKPLRSGSSLLQVLAAESIHDDAVENEMFRLLVQGGARLDETVFLHLCGWGNETMLQAMLEAGFPIQPRGNTTFEYLHAALNGHQPYRALPLLLGAGADINATDIRGRTLLLDMALSSHWIDRNLTELLKQQPDLEIAIQGSTAEWNGLTALGVAVEKGNMELAYRLLLAGAKATPQQVQPIFFHVLRAHPEQAGLMLTRYGASPSAPEPATGLSPIDLATRSGNVDLVSLLKSAQ